jgi:hypothetical protein
MHAPGGIRTHNLSRRAAAHLWLLDWLGLTYLEKFLPPIGKPSALFTHHFHRHFYQTDLDVQ